MELINKMHTELLFNQSSYDFDGGLSLNRVQPRQSNRRIAGLVTLEYTRINRRPPHILALHPHRFPVAICFDSPQSR